MKLRTLSKKYRALKVKESGNHIILIPNLDIPLDLLFNKEINEIKFEEFKKHQMPKPITFRFLDEFNNKHHKEFRGKVRFEIEGDGNAIDTYFVRKNEIEFFEFVQGFDEKFCR